MLRIDEALDPSSLAPKLDRFWDLSGRKIRLIAGRWDPKDGSPVITVGGRYTTRGWTEWTQGFQFGSAVLQFEATRDPWFLDYAREETLARMAPHVSHFGVHDHGFNNVSTYGNLLRLIREGIVPEDRWEASFYELALKVSAAVQARRWTPLPDGAGFIHSFNGPHSLFVDTIRSCRVLVIGHLLGHRMLGENDREIPLLGRAMDHAVATARHNIYYGEGRDAYDVEPGRTAHEAIFNTRDGRFRCPNSQQGFSGFTTWTRGLAWAITGFAELIELLAVLPPFEGGDAIDRTLRRAADAVCGYYVANCGADGIPYWDTGAPQLHRLGDWRNRPADPFNDCEPVDSSAAAIACQGLLRLGIVIGRETDPGRRWFQSGLTILKSLLSHPYLAEDPGHEGLVLHSIYHRPNGWDHVPDGRTVPCGEASMWGDYHAREAALFVHRLAQGRPAQRFFDCARLPRP